MRPGSHQGLHELVRLHWGSTIKLLVLCVATVTVYAAHYIRHRTRAINNASPGVRIPVILPWGLLVTAYASLVLHAVYLVDSSLYLAGEIARWMDLVYGLGLILWAFYARAGLHHLFSRIGVPRAWLRRIPTLLLTIFYVNFKINQAVQRGAELSSGPVGGITGIE